MIQHVTHVLVADKLVTSLTGIKKGEMVIVDQDNKEVNAGNAANASSIKFAVCKNTATGELEYSKEIQKNAKAKFAATANTPVQQANSVITLTGATITPEHRYVIRIVYKDIEAANLQFTHTYEIVAESEDATTLAAAFVEKINKHKNARVIASNSGAVITLTAKEKNDNEGVDSLNTYSIVSMEASFYVTKPGALLSNFPEKPAGVTIDNNAGNPGIGYWKQVRDMEVKNMGYKGHVFTGAYPAIAQKLNVTEGTAYNSVSVEWDNLYLSCDNQYIKTTPLTAQIFIAGESSSISAILKAFGAAEINQAVKE